LTDIVTDLPEGCAAVITMDQRRSRGGPDLVAGALPPLNDRYAEVLLRPFVRTAGDEVQAVTTSVTWLVDLILREAHRQPWWIGIGIGAVEPLAATASASRGEAFYRARDAVETAKRRPWGFALRGPEAFDRVERTLLLVSFIIRHRTDRQQAAADLYRVRPTARAVAEELGVSPSTISQSLRSAGVEEELAGRRLAEELLLEAARG
jgi:transcriptional regulator of aromatic amino acid metabolism